MFYNPYRKKVPDTFYSIFCEAMNNLNVWQQLSNAAQGNLTFLQCIFPVLGVKGTVLANISTPPSSKSFSAPCTSAHKKSTREILFCVAKVSSLIV